MKLILIGIFYIFTGCVTFNDFNRSTITFNEKEKNNYHDLNYEIQIEANGSDKLKLFNLTEELKEISLTNIDCSISNFRKIEDHESDKSVLKNSYKAIF